uniref:Transmembrane protein 243 n=1 Tax=Crocodylus porosus TaxID=8502 RepID=A0A7M4DUU3_CROPO
SWERPCTLRPRTEAAYWSKRCTKPADVEDVGVTQSFPELLGNQQGVPKCFSLLRLGFFHSWEQGSCFASSHSPYSTSIHPWQDRIINLAVGIVTSLLLLLTLISAFVFPQLPPKPVNIFFAFCISLCCISAGILIYWYRQGDLEPKFRNLIYYILFSIIMLCICANLYFHEVGK